MLANSFFFSLFSCHLKRVFFFHTILSAYECNLIDKLCARAYIDKQSVARNTKIDYAISSMANSVFLAASKAEY